MNYLTFIFQFLLCTSPQIRLSQNAHKYIKKTSDSCINYAIIKFNQVNPHNPYTEQAEGDSGKTTFNGKNMKEN